MKIYAYSTDSALNKGRIKVGQTAKDDVLSRIKNQDNSSCHEPLEHIQTWSVEDSITDHKIHQVLMHVMGKNRVRKEWFEATTEDVQSAITLYEEKGESLFAKTPVVRTRKRIRNGTHNWEVGLGKSLKHYFLTGEKPIIEVWAKTPQHEKKWLENMDFYIQIHCKAYGELSFLNYNKEDCGK